MKKNMLSSTHNTTLCLKKCTNLETVYLTIVSINFDEILQKYSKDSRFEFAFSCRFAVYQLFVFQTGHQKQLEF